MLTLLLILTSLVEWTRPYPRNCLFAQDVAKCIHNRLDEKGMKRIFLTGNNAPTCNDGTPAGYAFYYYFQLPTMLKFFF